jgi:ABC-type multidrug transport system fused ATPase/permease subunit
MEEVEEAAKVADAHNFITSVLSDGYETNVGQVPDFDLTLA